MDYMFSINEVKKSTLVRKIGPILMLLYFLNPKIALSQDYEEWKREQEEQFQLFKDERDAEFLKMLENAWEVMEADLNGDFREPKPEAIPEAGIRFDSSLKNIDESKTIDLNITEIGSDNEISGDDFMKVQSQRIPAGVLQSSLNYYNVEIDYFYFAEGIYHLKGRPTQENLMDYWAKMSQINYDPMINRIREVREKLYLNDWGTLLLVNKMAHEIIGSSVNDMNLFIWFTMTKLGYDLKVGYNSSDIYVLFATSRRLYNTKFLTFGVRRYYVIQLQENNRDVLSMNTYRGNYPGAKKELNLSIDSIPRFPSVVNERELSFRWQDEEYRLTVPVNSDLIDFYRFFPNADMDVYVNASTSSGVNRVLLSQLAQVVNGKNQNEAVSILLHFVQSAFRYKTDDEQFGKQKYMMPDEILHYPYSDCDDRTILFTYLVKQLLELDVIGLRYPNHIATAVKLDLFDGGDYVIYEGEKYIVADPTYINAQIGMTMPKYQNISPELVRLF